MQVTSWQDEQFDAMSPQVSRAAIHTESMTYARIRLRKGAVVPMHEHVNEQIATVLEGKMKFTGSDGSEHVLSPGETIVFPANVPHQAEALEDSDVIDAFSPVREDWLRGDDSYLRR